MGMCEGSGRAGPPATATSRDGRSKRQNYQRWTTADGRELRPSEMSDLHLLHTLRAIEEGRVLPELPAGPPLGHLAAVGQRKKDREAWLAIFRGEAARRGLDPSVPPTRRVDILELALRLAGKEVGFGTCQQERYVLDAMRRGLARAGIPLPEIDVLTATGEPSYLHWRAGKGVGTPLPVPEPEKPADTNTASRTCP
jgi:hypothetical protein